MSVALDLRGSTQVGDVQWDLDNDGQFDDASGLSIDLDWNALVAAGIDNDGIYTIGATVTTSSGTGVASTQLVVANAAPTVLLTSSSLGVVGQPMTMQISSSDPSPLDVPVGWLVDWDGSGPGTAEVFGPVTAVTHTYTEPGVYPVEFSVIDNDSAPQVASSATFGVVISVDSSSLSAGGAYTIAEGQLLSLAATSVATPTAIRWDLDNDGQFDDATGASPSLAWDAFQQLQPAANQDDGTFDIAAEFEFTGNPVGGETFVVNSQVIVSNAPPTADQFTNNGPVLQSGGGTVSFVSPSDPAAADRSSLTFDYDFGADGTFEIAGSASPTAAIPLEFLTQAGDLQVIGRINDKDHGQAVFSTTVEVLARGPLVGLTPSASEFDEGDPTFTFTTLIDNFGGGIVNNLSIDWGDGTSEAVASAGDSIPHVYTDNGNPTISFSYDYDVPSEK